MYTINLSSQITTIPYLVQPMLLDNNSFSFQKFQQSIFRVNQDLSLNIVRFPSHLWTSPTGSTKKINEFKNIIESKLYTFVI
jgi:hypothetical protein